MTSCLQYRLLLVSSETVVDGSGTVTGLAYYKLQQEYRAEREKDKQRAQEVKKIKELLQREK